MSTDARAFRVLAVAGAAPWPLRHGGRLRLHHWLRELATQAEVTLLTPHGPAPDGAIPHGVRHAYPAEGAAEHLRQRGAAAFFGRDERVGTWVREHSTEFDVILLSGAGRSVYAADSCAPCVCDIVDDPILHLARDAKLHPLRWLRTLRSMAGFAISLRETLGLCSAAVVASESDARSLARYAAGTPIHVLENGVDVGAFTGRPLPTVPDTVVFVGSLSFQPNIDAVLWFAKTVWPTLAARGIGRRWLIVGKQPVAEIRALAAIPGIEIAADVADVRPYLARATVAIVPMRSGGGIKNKILEACAARRPVVASPIAARDLSARNGRELLLARRPAEWITAIELLLCDQTLAESIARAGRAWVVGNHAWSDFGNRLGKLLRAAAGRDFAAESPPVEFAVVAAEASCH